MSKTHKRATGKRFYHSGVFDAEKKALMRKRILEGEYSEDEYAEDFINARKTRYRKYFLCFLLIPIMASSCVSKKMLILEQDKVLEHAVGMEN